MGSVPGLEENGSPLQYSFLENPMDRSPADENGNPLQYSFLENPMDRGAWRATVHGVIQSWACLKRLSTAHVAYPLNMKIASLRIYC